MIKKYYYLAKPGIIYGNLITTTAGFFLAASGHFNIWLLLSALIGISLVMASACVFNNLLDRKIDAQMERTQSRALVVGAIPTRNAIAYGFILGILGFLILWLFTNPLTTLIALIGFAVYVGVYTPLKRRTVYATLIGSIAGAVPPVVGYMSVANRFDAGSMLIFFILVFWQMPHFYSIAIFRLSDYTQAGIPVLPAKKGIYFTKLNILAYIFAFAFVTGLLTIFGLTSPLYLAAAWALSLIWLWYALGGFRKGINDKLWARKMFRVSLIVLTLLSVVIVLDSIVKNPL